MECIICFEEFKPNSNNQRICYDVDCIRFGKIIYFREYRKRNHKQMILMERKYEKTPERKAKKKVRSLVYQRKNRATLKEKNKKFAWKERARQILRYEVKKGSIKRNPCEQCGNPITDAHHTDYTKPLDVQWLCRAHHIFLHKAFKNIMAQ